MEKQALILIAKPGYGKTYRARMMLAQVLNESTSETSFVVGELLHSPDVMVFDPEEQFESLRGYDFRFYQGEGPKKVKDYPYWRFDDITDLIDATRWLDKQDDKIIIIDELLLAEGLDFTSLKKLSVARRHWGCDIIACSQRPVSFPVAYFALADQVHVGRIDDHRDLKHLESTGLFEPDELQAIRSYDVGHFLRKTK